MGNVFILKIYEDFKISIPEMLEIFFDDVSVKVKALENYTKCL